MKAKSKLLRGMRSGRVNYYYPPSLFFEKNRKVKEIKKERDLMIHVTAVIGWLQSSNRPLKPAAKYENNVGRSCRSNPPVDRNYLVVVLI